MQNLIQNLYQVKEFVAKSPAENIVYENLYFKLIGYCYVNLNLSESQNFQDLWALFESQGKTSGFFVEFGSANPKAGSNTYCLEQHFNWNGILCEPNPVYHESIESIRKSKLIKKCVYTESNQKLKFNMTSDPVLSTIDGYGNDDEWSQTRKNGASLIEVETISLIDLLDSNQAPINIDYMSVDTEGSEYDIMSSFFESNNNRYQVKCVSIEHNFVPEFREKIYNLMLKNGYQRKFEIVSRWDDFYIKL